VIDRSTLGDDGGDRGLLRLPNNCDDSLPPSRREWRSPADAPDLGSDSVRPERFRPDRGLLRRDHQLDALLALDIAACGDDIAP
jgi:hypothetical protein